VTPPANRLHRLRPPFVDTIFRAALGTRDDSHRHDDLRCPVFSDETTDIGAPIFPAAMCERVTAFSS
jgi:hypothetical protein